MMSPPEYTCITESTRNRQKTNHSDPDQVIFEPLRDWCSDKIERQEIFRDRGGWHVTMVLAQTQTN